MKTVRSVRKRCFVLFVAFTATVALGATVNAATIGAGIEILNLPGANNTVDTPSDGTTDQSRQNVDVSFTATLEPGEYVGTSWSFRAGQTGAVIPYIAAATGPDSYEILAVGDLFDVVPDVLDLDLINLPFGGSSFTLSAATEIFGGIVNPKEPGSQNPVYTNLASGSQVDHDNNADGNLSPAVVGGAVDGFGHANLARSYAFSIEVDPVPEPSAGFAMIVLSGIAVFLMRRR